jgi:hypothetical protein
LTALQASYQQAFTSWQKFIQALIDTNALGLGEGQLNTLKQLVTVQNLRFETLNRILKDPNTATLLANLQEIQTQLDELMAQIAPNIAAKSADTSPGPSLAPDGGKAERDFGRRRFRLLR